MAEWLAAQGHEVRAVVAAPFYPQWKVADGYSGLRYRRETVRGVDVIRCPIYVPRRQSGLARMIQLLLFAMAGAPVLLGRAMSFKPDVVWTMMPPLAGMPVALLAAKTARAPAWVHVQDFEVDAAFELGLLKSPRLRRLVLKIERSLLSAFRIASSITPSMVRLLETKGVTAEKRLFPNWVDTSLIYPLADANALRGEIGIAHTDFVALYSGNLGEKQGVDDLIEVARLLADQLGFVMVICGDGVGRARLAEKASGLSNIVFVPLQPSERFNQLLNMADVHLLPQKPEVADLVMPSKLPGMLASGRPVIAGARAGTQLAQEMEGCGRVVAPGDPMAMAGAVRELMAAPQERARLGAQASRRAKDRWAKTAILSQFEAALIALVPHQKSLAAVIDVPDREN